MNKYIEHLTVGEYKMIEKQLKERLPILAERVNNSEIGKKEYIEIRFILLKIRKIIEKYEK